MTPTIRADMTDQKTQMREGFEAQRKAGMNVDWFTWQIAWHDALFTVHDLVGDATGRQPAAIDKECTCKGVLGHSRQCAIFDESMMAAPSVEQDERGAFEQALKTGVFDEDRLSDYSNCETEAAWRGWQARAASTSANVAQRDALSAVADDIASMSADELRAEHESHRHGDIAVALRELSADVAQGAEADTLRNLLSHCWEFKTGFDKKTQQPTAIKATFKATTIASAHACDGMGAMVADFLAAAQSASGDTKP